MTIGVIIPIVHEDYIHKLLDCIQRNSTQPSEIIIVDNSRNTLKVAKNITVIKPRTPMGVNASWNYGIQKLINHDLISVLNDDLLIEELFFEKLQRLSEAKLKVGVFCPETRRDMSVFSPPYPIYSATCSPMNRREGWAWTIRSSVARQIPPIPTQLKTWCGDDWYWTHCYRLGYPWMKMEKNICFHYVGQSCKLVDKRKDLNPEKALFRSLL